MSKPKRRRWTAHKKLKIVLETLQSDQKLAEICRREGISPTQVYQWRRQLSASAEAIFARKQTHGEDRRIAKLATENQRMKNVVAAIATLEVDVRPEIQRDHGSGFISREFAETLAACGVGHTKIRPRTPTDNAEIERYHRTIGERIDEEDMEDVTQAKRVIASIIGAYNHIRLHSALSFLRPVDYYRGDPEALPAKRRGKLPTARGLRKQENIKLRQRLIPGWRTNPCLIRRPRLSHFA